MRFIATGAPSFNLSHDDFIASRIGARQQPSNGAKAARLSSWQERKAKKLMVEHLAEPLNLGEIAQSCYVSRGYFISAFCASAGLTPHQWLIGTRLRVAQEMLLSTDLSLAEIALNCGFYDQSHFSRTFAHRTGLPPGRWRKERVVTE